MRGISDIEHLAAGLDAIAGQKAVAEYIEKADIPARNQRAAVAVMIKDAQSLLGHLQSADLSTRETIFANYPNVRLDHEPDERTRKLGLFNRDIEHIERLLHGLEAAERALPKTGGRPPLRVLSQACLELIRLYESTPGREFKLDYHSSATGFEFIPAGAQFVARCALVLFPDATTANLITAMRNANKRKANKRKAVLAETSPQ
jgi:hypothetical protein